MQLLASLATTSQMLYVRTPAINAFFPNYRGSTFGAIADTMRDNGIWVTADLYPRYACDYGTPRVPPSSADFPEPPVYTYCADDDPAVLIRGAKNAPRPAGDDTAGPPPGADLGKKTDPTPKGRFTIPTPRVVRHCPSNLRGDRDTRLEWQMDDENDTTARKRLPRGQGWQLRQQIIDTAMDLILSSGEARAPSARELTRALGITAPSLYRHFSSTDELADALCARYFEQLGRHCSGLRSTCPRRWSACTHSDWPMCVMLRSIRCGTASRRPILHASGRNPMKYSAAQPFCICGTSFKSWLTRSVFPR